MPVSIIPQAETYFPLIYHHIYTLYSPSKCSHIHLYIFTSNEERPEWRISTFVNVYIFILCYKNNKLADIKNIHNEPYE